MRHSLCYRCEHRALFWESGKKHHPRYECGEPESSKSTCYMYQPVKPVVVARAEGYEDDPRPLSTGYFSCRFTVQRVADVVLVEHQEREGVFWFWKPKADDHG